MLLTWVVSWVVETVTKVDVERGLEFSVLIPVQIKKMRRILTSGDGVGVVCSQLSR